LCYERWGMFEGCTSHSTSYKAKFMGSIPDYGYKLSPNDKHKLIIDERYKFQNTLAQNSLPISSLTLACPNLSSPSIQQNLSTDEGVYNTGTKKKTRLPTSFRIIRVWLLVDGWLPFLTTNLVHITCFHNLDG